MADMNRRRALLALTSVPLLVLPVHGETPQPYQVSLLSGGKIDGVLQAGLLVELQPGWKTYWRMPGDAGIPPQFDWTGSGNVAAVEVMFPIPGRFRDASGETIGYHDQVLFPLSVRPKNASETVQLQLNLFFAVCKEVCIPARVKIDFSLTSANASPLVGQWRQRVPRVAGKDLAPPVSTARIEIIGEKPMLVLSLSRTVEDIFVESPTSAYFGQPRFDKSPHEAWLPIMGLKDVAKLRGIPLTLTSAFGNSGIEQTLAVN